MVSVGLVAATLVGHKALEKMEVVVLLMVQMQHTIMMFSKTVHAFHGCQMG